MGKNIVIITGGQLEPDVLMQTLTQSVDLIIAVDHGLEYLYTMYKQGKCTYVPNYIVGDFDSVNQAVLSFYRDKLQVTIRQYNPIKDASDTEIAVHLALELGADSITILGGTGTRIDHVLANIQVLTIPFKVGVTAKILDAHNRIQLIASNTVLNKKERFGDYFSVFSLGDCVTGLTIQGAKYPLVQHRLLPENSLSVSNQFINEEVIISYETGVLVLIESRD